MRFFKKFTCEKCSDKFSHQEELMNHQQIVHGKDYQYDCKECNTIFFKYGRYANTSTKST